MKNFLCTVCLVAAFTAMSACKDDDTPPAISGKDQTTMEQISYGNIAEIELGMVADSISPTPEVKDFGRMMIADHTVAQAELEQIASKWSLDLPQTPDSLHRAKKQQLMMMSGHAFDTAYIASQIKDHKATIALLEMAADNSGQQSIRNYATKYLPKVKMHLEHAEALALELQP